MSTTEFNGSIAINGFNPLSTQLSKSISIVPLNPLQALVSPSSLNSAVIDFNPSSYAIADEGQDSFIVGNQTVNSLTFKGTELNDRLYFRVNTNNIFAFSKDGTNYTNAMVYNFLRQLPLI